MITLRRAVAGDAAAIAEVYLALFKATYAFPLAHTDDEVRGWVRDHLVATQETWVAVEDRCKARIEHRWENRSLPTRRPDRRERDPRRGTT